MPDTFTRALEISREVQEPLRGLMPFGINDFVAEIGGLAATLEHLEREYGEFASDLETYASLPEVVTDEGALRYLGVAMRDFNSGHTLLRGMAAQARDGRPVDMEIFRSAFLRAQPFYEAASSIFQQAFGHDFYGMIDQSRS
ncbi:MAG: hypothetical protein OXR66_00270 [Candidatus Woesearchaeota archaeon]|nr:hypothetical protein [Candidatus Woesearchaeota archaeon]